MSSKNGVDINPEDLERLANRVAQLAGYDQDADNAGRAVAALVRRIGISAGDLRDWLIAGALARKPLGPEPTIRAPNAADLRRLEQSLANSEHSLRVVEAQLRHAQNEREAMREENELLIEALDRARSAEQVRRYVGLAVVAAAILGAVVITSGPSLRPIPQGPTTRPFGSPFLRQGVVRGAGATVYRVPQTTGMVVTQLAAGSRVQVRQTVERDLLHWVEIEVGGISGYVLSTEIDVADPGLR